MVYLSVIILLSILACVWASTYHSVSFLPTTKITSTYNTFTIHNQPIRKKLKGYSYFSPLEALPLHQDYYFDKLSVGNFHNEDIGPPVHTTPDFSNGLDYPDPFLVTGFVGKGIAKLLYSHELFFNDYPHISALLRHQKIRRENHLDGHNLGSLRPTSPFYRFKNAYTY